jgi:hypothetical protein
MTRTNETYAFDEETRALVCAVYALVEQDFRDRLTDTNRAAVESEVASAIGALAAGGQRDIERLRTYAASKVSAIISQNSVTPAP